MIDNKQSYKWVIYVHTVPKEITGYNVDKRYVGITRQEPEMRWMNGYGYKGQMFYSAIKKWGWQNIRHDIITETSDYSKALQLEEMYILLLRTNENQYGYNCYIKRDKEKIYKHEYCPSDVSLGNHPGAKKVICLNTLEIFDCMVSAGKAYNISHHHIGSCCYGKIKSIGRHPVTKEPLMWEFYDENKEYIIKSYPQNSRGRKVVCLTTKELFLKVRDAEKKYNLTHRSIDRNCNGVKSRGGAGKLEDGTLLQWQYYIDYLKENNLTDEEARKSLFFIA